MTADTDPIPVVPRSRLDDANARADKWCLAYQKKADEFSEALSILARIVAQANVNPVEGDDGFTARYDMPTGSIHRAIPFLARFGVVVDVYGAIHRTESSPLPVEGAFTNKRSQR